MEDGDTATRHQKTARVPCHLRRPPSAAAGASLRRFTSQASLCTGPGCSQLSTIRQTNRVSSICRRAGAKVAICELPFGFVSSDSVGGAGGTCVLRGCVPKKLMVYAAGFTQEFRESRGFGSGAFRLAEETITLQSSQHRNASCCGSGARVWCGGERAWIETGSAVGSGIRTSRMFVQLLAWLSRTAD